MDIHLYGSQPEFCRGGHVYVYPQCPRLDYSNEGTLHSMRKDTSTRMNLFSRLDESKKEECRYAVSMSKKERHNLYATMADDAFDEEL